MKLIPTEPAHLSAEWLTETLRGHGHLPQGEVVAVEQTGVTNSYVATHVRLGLTYSLDAPENAPARLFAKLSQEHPALGPKEAIFYGQVVQRMAETVPRSALPFVRCFGYGHDPESLRAFLFLEDVSDSHAPGQRPLPPTLHQCEGAIDALAHLHAFFFEDRAGMESLCEWPNRERIDQLFTDAVGNGADFLGVVGDRFSDARRERLARICAKWPRRRLQRTLDGVGLTLVHRDAHAGNFLFPHSGVGAALLIDWDAWRVQTGTDDLAYFMAAAWYPDLRARWEVRLLRRYFSALESYGVTRYTWEDCLLDYRESIIRNLFTFVGGYRKGRAPALWWERVERLLMAYDEWACGELE